MRDAARQICFVDMPFGKKQDLKSGVEIDFWQAYEQGGAPAIIAQGLNPIQGDREEIGGISHTATVRQIAARLEAKADALRQGNA